MDATPQRKFVTTTTVANLRDVPEGPQTAYIGRAGHDKDGYFGNPFRENVYGREYAISLFREYFYKRLGFDDEFVIRINALKGKTLLCFCKPKECHGDVIAKYLNG